MTMTMPKTTDNQIATTTDSIIFPDGLVGCQDWKNFILMTDDGDEELPVAILQSLDDASVSLMVTDPRFLEPSFAPQLSAQDCADLGLDDASQTVVYCTLSTADGWLTANLLGPLVLNPITRRGKQVVVVDSAYSTRYRIAPLGSTGV
jgi:flagellar assembly factor FliW